jgi:hypothetical protein
MAVRSPRPSRGAQDGPGSAPHSRAFSLPKPAAVVMMLMSKSVPLARESQPSALAARADSKEERP